MKIAEVLIKGLLGSLGYVLSILPARGVAWLSAVIGRIFYATFPERRRVLLSNLDHAFPHRSWSWKKRIGRTSCGRMVEMGCLALASPFFTEARIRRHSSLSEALQKCLLELRDRPRPIVLWIPHLSMLESATWLPLFVSEFSPKTHVCVLFRPLKNPWLNDWVCRTRERFGVELLSRKDGLLKAKERIRSNAVVALLGDQNAGKSGVLTHFMGRLASTSDLVSLLAACGHQAEVYALWPRCLGFAKVRFEIERLAKNPCEQSWAQAGNRWLENLLRSDESICEDWLWAHRRWHTQDEPHSFLHIDHKRNAFADDPAVRADIVRCRQTRLWIRLPNWLGDFVMAVPLLRKLRDMRPDATITLLGQASLAPLVSRWGLADCFLSLPNKTWRYFWDVRSLSHEMPDFYILLTHSLRGDLEAKVLRAHETFGIQLPRRKRIFVRYPWVVPADASEIHQTRLWERFFQSMGMREEISNVPQETYVRAATNIVALICGSSNMPAKRWPMVYWEQLASRLLSSGHCQRIILLGTARDAAHLSGHEGFFDERITSLVGKTDLNELANILSACSVVAGNDTGGVHLANAMGVPTVVLYGPTSSRRTGLFFDAPHIELHSADEKTMEKISVDQVEKSILSFLV
jgi:lauroyl/myristoyl acyltransferase/ADP-heptose:LPS heptosyltransferase